MKVYFVNNFSEGYTKQQAEAFARNWELTTPDKAEVIFCGSIDSMNTALSIYNKRDIPLVVYCWDYYKWAHEGKNTSWDWSKYSNFLTIADAIIVPSTAQAKRLKELLGLDSSVVVSGVETFEAEVTDGDFILDPVRYYPEENQTWAEDAARDLNIPIVHSEHSFSKEEFRKLVASCSFMTCAYREASTGGLTLIEGLWLGKPSLVSDSPYMGARDYIDDYGYYFKYDDFDDLKEKMWQLWTERPKKEAREYVANKFSFDRMAKEIEEILCEAKNNY